MLAAMTGLVTPQARPSAALEVTKTYGTFCIAGLEVMKKKPSGHGYMQAGRHTMGRQTVPTWQSNTGRHAIPNGADGLQQRTTRWMWHRTKEKKPTV